MDSAAHDRILAISLDWMTAHFDEGANLLRHPGNARVHRIRESLWFAAGLIVRSRDADVIRASTIIDGVLATQYDESGAVWDGTFPRTLEEPRPQHGAVIWRDYDPNWRQFIGCVLALLLRDYSNVLGGARCERVHDAIGLTLRGEPPLRIEPSYSNIALLQAWLLCQHGDRQRGEALASDVEILFDAQQGFSEYNSPTYYGVDLWALALWRGSENAVLAAAGRRLEVALWRDVAAFYHPGLWNLCGPYDRAYGMDMTRYASLLGLWLWWGCDVRAFPDPASAFKHAHDFCATPLLALAPPQIPDDVVMALATPVVSRTLRRVTPERIVTATLLPELMLGAVAPARADATGQARPVTAHWRSADGSLAWLSIRGALAAEISETSIALRSDAELILELSSAATELGERRWTIGGRHIEVRGIEVLPGHAIRLPSGSGSLRFV